MKSQQVIMMMERCAVEIETQRREIAFLKPKAEAYDVIAKILGLVPPMGNNIGYSEDLVWLLRKNIEEMIGEQLKSQVPEEETQS